MLLPPARMRKMLWRFRRIAKSIRHGARSGSPVDGRKRFGVLDLAIPFGPALGAARRAEDSCSIN
jgi:hypothetical protein